jgi:hypothetical protein
MAEHVWSVLCSKALIDNETQMVSLIEVVERVIINERGEFEEAIANAPSDARPLLPHLMYLMSWWVRTNRAVPETGAFRIRTLLPSGEYSDIVAAFVISLENNTGFRARLRIPGIPWAGIGLYWFVIEEQLGEEEWRISARIPLEVVFKDDIQQTVGAPQAKDHPVRKAKKGKRKMRKGRA